MDKQSPAVAEIEQSIRDYLRAHPHAEDTERGIREWWLHDAPSRYREADVHEAIEHLVATGELARRALPDGQRVHALAPPGPASDSRPPDRP